MKWVFIPNISPFILIHLFILVGYNLVYVQFSLSTMLPVMCCFHAVVCNWVLAQSMNMLQAEIGTLHLELKCDSLQ